MQPKNIFHTKIVGVTHSNTGANTENRQRIIRDLYRKGQLVTGQELDLKREPHNPFDHNAVAIIGPDGRQLGYLSKELARTVSTQMGNGTVYKAYVECVTGGDADWSYGVNIRLEMFEKETKVVQQPNIGKETVSPDIPAQFKLPSLVPYDSRVQALLKAALAGDVSAQHNMGGCYLEGVGVDRNPLQAAYWFEQAANQGDLSAQCNLGLMYMNGHGVEKDPIKALMWFFVSANEGHADSQNNLGCCYLEGVGGDRNYQEAAKWLKLAADNDHPAAMFNLGLLYLDGIGVAKDISCGLKFIAMSAQRGHNPAIEFINTLNASGK